MVAIQTSIADKVAEGREGMIATMEPCTVTSYVASDTAAIGFGKAVHQGATADGASIGVSGAGSSPYAVTKFLGVTVRDRTRLADDGGYRKGASMSVLSRGVIWVKVESAVTVGADVTINETTGEFSTATASSTRHFLPRARFLDAAAADGLARIEIDTSHVGAA